MDFDAVAARLGLGPFRSLKMPARAFYALDVSRRRLLAGTGTGALAAIALGVSPAAAGAKFSQKMAQYQPTPKGPQNCGNCVQFEPPNACKVVEGVISPNGWSMLWSPKK